MPDKTWACATHKQFTMQAVAVATVKATWAWVRGKCEEAMREVLGAGRGVQAGEVETPARQQQHVYKRFMRLATHTSEAFRKHSLRRLEAQRVLLQPNLGVSAAQ
jgi:hypothetical protein